MYIQTEQTGYVLPRPKITTDIPRILCLGGDKQQIITEKSGTWVSSNVTVATMNNNGELTLFGPGMCILYMIALPMSVHQNL
ncbi:MAG: hypothetical protein IPG18_18110 [Saprospiraceae bacterium]|nr:hypothetical protein [Saprospiraceae bacterium]